MTAVPSGPHDSDDIGMIELGHHDDFLGNGFHHTLLLGARIATKRNLKLYGLFNGRNNSKQISHHSYVRCVWQTWMPPNPHLSCEWLNLWKAFTKWVSFSQPYHNSNHTKCIHYNYILKAVLGQIFFLCLYTRWKSVIHWNAWNPSQQSIQRDVICVQQLTVSWIWC